MTGVLSAGRRVLDKLLEEAGEMEKRVKEAGSEGEDAPKLLVQAARLLEDLEAAQASGLSRLCDGESSLAPVSLTQQLGARIRVMEQWVRSGGKKGLEQVQEKLLEGATLESGDPMDLARDLGTLIDMQRLRQAGPGSKALIRLEMRLPFRVDAESRADPEWQEVLAAKRSKVLSALTDYAKRVTKADGVCMRLVRLEPLQHQGQETL